MEEHHTVDSLKDKPNLNEVLLEWKGPSYPFKKRDRMFFQTVAALTILLVVIVFFLHEFLLIGVILSVAFVVYVISSVPPIEVAHKITPLGLDNAEKLFHWQELYAFWFTKKWGFTTLIVQTRLPFPAQIHAVLSGVSEEKVKEIVGKYLLHMDKPPKSWVDSASDWLSNKVPLEARS